MIEVSFFSFPVSSLTRKTKSVEDLFSDLSLNAVDHSSRVREFKGADKREATSVAKSDCPNRLVNDTCS